jgi:RyR domain
MARRASSRTTGAAEPNFVFLGFRDEWYVLRAELPVWGSQAALAFEGRVAAWLIDQWITPGTWSHFGRGNTGEYPVVPDDNDLYLLLKRPADVLRCEAIFRCTGLDPDSLLAAIRAEAGVYRFRVDDVVRITYNAIYTLMQTFGDSYPSWESVGGETRVAFILQITHRLAHLEDPIEQLHTAWVAQREKDGWHYGGQFSIQNLTDPLLVPWKHLNVRTRTRYHLLASTVASLSPLLK